MSTFVKMGNEIREKLFFGRQLTNLILIYKFKILSETGLSTNTEKVLVILNWFASCKVET